MSNSSKPIFSNKAEAFEAFDDTPTHTLDTPTLGDVIQQRFGRRDVLKGALAVTTVSYLLGSGLSPASATSGKPQSAFDFNELQAGIDANHHVADGYEADILLRWEMACLKTLTHLIRRFRRRRASIGSLVTTMIT